MPTLISRGAASAKAFGLTNGSLNLTTTTFTSNGTWVAPAGVALVIVLSGRGQDGSPYNINATNQYYCQPNVNTWGNPAYAQWSDIYGRATSARSTMLAAVGGAGPSSLESSYSLYISTVNNSWAVANNGYDDYSAYTIVSVSGIYTEGNTATSGNIVSSSLSFGINGFKYDFVLGVPGFLGASSTAISQTFPGGNGGPAPVTTFNNIAVTPGASYPIVVASGGYVTIQYLAP